MENKNRNVKDPICLNCLEKDGKEINTAGGNESSEICLRCNKLGTGIIKK